MRKIVTNCNEVNCNNLIAGTGSFGRVCLCKGKDNEDYFAMKILSIVNVVKSKQVEHVKNEKNILMELSLKNHPFIVNLYVFSVKVFLLFLFLNNY